MTRRFRRKDEYDAVYKTAYAAMPHVTLLRVNGSRHFIMYDQPETFDAAIEGWLK
jgi:pimeloyl-ACP methyl ester carboxylesterase